MAGRDFDLAFAPERVNPGDPASAMKDVPRLVGGTTPAATTRAATLLRRINDHVVELTSPDAAELAKLLENVFRNVNIALVNQLALLCERMGVDVWEVIDAAATKPFGFMRFTPGPGVGGHCIPVDPYYLSWRAREFDFVDRFVELAGDINLAMPRHVVDLVAEALNDRGLAIHGAQVGILGVAFKPNVRDPRNSPAADVIAGLRERGAELVYHDPHVPTFRRRDGSEDDAQRSTSSSTRATSSWSSPPTRRSTGTPSTRARTWSSTPSTGRAARRRADRQVLRLGAGWAPPGRDAHPRLPRRTPRVRREAECLAAAGYPVDVFALRQPGAGREAGDPRRRSRSPNRRPAPPGRGPRDVPARVPRVPRPRVAGADRAYPRRRYGLVQVRTLPDLLAFAACRCDWSACRCCSTSTRRCRSSSGRASRARRTRSSTACCCRASGSRSGLPGGP